MSSRLVFIKTKVKLTLNGLLVEVAEHSHGTFQLHSTSPESRLLVQVNWVSKHGSVRSYPLRQCLKRQLAHL